ncbi:MAG: hypothetical protein ABIT08_13725 [Bacteroidia bacterium]
MKTLKNLSLSLTLIALTAVAGKAAILKEEGMNRSTSVEKEFSVKNKLTSGTCIRAVVKNGKVLPQVMLPVVTITGERNSKKMVRAIKKGKTVIALVDLPELVITGQRINNNYKLRIVAAKNGTIAVVDLPEVVISAERTGMNSYALVKLNENKIPIVDLTEVVIAADFAQSKMLPAIFYKGQYIAVVNLPEVEIIAEKPKQLTAAADKSLINKRRNLISGIEKDVAVKTNIKFSELVFNLVRKALVQVNLKS